jgi:hypothetical protein
VFRVANTRVKRAVAGDANAFAQKQAKVAENLQWASCPRQWAQQVRSMAGVAPGRGAPGCILNSVGVPLHTPQAILDRFGEHFAGVFGGGVDISPTTRDSLEYCVREIESSLGVGGEACDVAEPSMQEVADCVAALWNATVPGADGITTPLLKAGLEPVAWLHRVILAVWRSSRSPEAWWSHCTRARARTSAPTTIGESIC